MLTIGIDESGTGAWAGSYVISAVAADEELLRASVPELNDSKKLSDKKRRRLVPLIHEHAFAYVSTEVEVERITRGHKSSWLWGVSKTLRNITDKLEQGTEFRVVVDGTEDDRLYSRLRGKYEYLHEHISFRQKADQTHSAVMAASILAKTFRNDLMIELDAEFPEFLWAKNAGYGTAEHLAACERHGLTAHHRPIRRLEGFSQYKPATGGS